MNERPGLPGVSRSIQIVAVLLVLAAAVALVAFLPLGAKAGQAEQGQQGPELAGAQPLAGSGDPFYAEVFAPIKDDVNIKVPYQSLKTWDPAKDQSVVYYQNLPPIQPSVVKKTANIPRVMGIQNYDNPTAAGGNINTKQSGPTYFYDRQIFEGWNFIDEYVTFGWGPISLPSPQEIAIAHKNGLPVIATVMFGNSSGESERAYEQDARDLLSKEGGRYWAVDKLAQLADTFHFEGWFINMELNLYDPAGLTDYVAACSEFVTQLGQKRLQNGSRLRVVWYDTIDQSGIKTYPGLTPQVAALFFTPVAGGQFFNDYQHMIDTEMNTTRTNAGAKVNEAFMGANWWEWCQGQVLFSKVQALQDNNKTWAADKQLPLGLWAVGFPTLGNNLKYDPHPVSAQQIHEYVASYWWNSRIIPEQKFDEKTDPDGKIPLNGMGKAVADYHQRTSVTSLPFKTDFDLGKGDRYFHNGNMTSAAPWGNLIEQDILPNYLVVDGGVKASFDFTDAFNGGTSLKVANSGAGAYAKDIPIFLAQIENKDPAIGEARVTYKNAGGAAGEFYLKYADGRYSRGVLEPTGGSWKEIAVDARAGQALVEIGVSRVPSGSSLNLGEIEVVGEAHLEATMYADPVSIEPGGTVTYTTAITNTSGLDASGVVFTDQVPTGTSMVAGSLRCSDEGATVVSTSPVMVGGIHVKAKDTVTVEFAVKAGKGLQAGSRVSNQGHVSYGNIQLPTSDSGHPGKGLPTVVVVEGRDPGSTELLIPEGSTGGGFDTWILLQNPGGKPASVTIDFKTEAGPAPPLHLTVPQMSRTSIRMADHVPDLWQISTLIRSDRPLVAERSTYWNRLVTGESQTPGEPTPSQMLGGHSGPAVPLSGQSGVSGTRGPSHVNYFAEGASGGMFDSWVLLYNPNPTDAEAKVTLMTDMGEVTAKSVPVRANSRATVHLDEQVPDSYHVSTEVLSDKPLVAERSVYWDADAPSKQPWQMMGGHSTLGATSPLTRWFLAECPTGGGFDTYLLLLNPNTKEVTAHLSFSNAKGVVKTALVDIPARSRLTLKASDYAPDDFDVAVRVLCSEPVVVERSTYWDGRSASTSGRMRGGTSGAGVSSASHTWLVAEGSTAGGFDSWVLVSNVGASATTARVTFLGAWGETGSKVITLPPQARCSIHLNAEVPGQDGVATLVESGGSLVVEQAMYWDRAQTDKPYEMMGGSSAPGVQH